MSRGTLALSGRAHDDLGAGDRACSVELLAGPVACCHRNVSRRGGLVSRNRRDIAGIGGRVALVGGVHPVHRRLVALTGAALPDLLAGVVLLSVGAVGEVTIAGCLVAIRRELIAVSARLITIRAGLIGV